MTDWKTLELGNEYTFLAKDAEGEYSEKTGTLNAIFKNSDGYTSVQFITKDDAGNDVNHDVQIARLDTSDEMIERLKEADKFAEERQAELEKTNMEAFEVARSSVKAVYDEVYG